MSFGEILQDNWQNAPFIYSTSSSPPFLPFLSLTAKRKHDSTKH
ncbi:MAG: hypothetical protein ACXAEU_03070 [Candidatus Hodarchaeales archaeon]